MPKVVVAAVDDTEESQQAVAWLEGFLPRQDQLKLLMVVPEQHGAYSGGAASHSHTPQKAAEVVLVPTGSSEAIGAALLERAQAAHAALLALAPHARSATQRVLHGSVTDYCCRHSRLPVLVVQGVTGGGSASGGKVQAVREA